MIENPGEIFEGTVRDLASDGRGVVSHPEGRTYFVPGVWIGERVQARITQVKGKVGYADCVEVLDTSEHRVPAPCPHHGVKQGKCGGCAWQFITYEAQLDAKQNRVEKQFMNVVEEACIRRILPSSLTLGYRNRAQFKTEGKRIGYVSPQSKVLAEVKDCLILTDKNRQTFKELKQSLPNNMWKPKKKFKWTTLDIDESVTALAVRMNQRLPFQQGNDVQNAQLLRWLEEKLSTIDKDKNVLELFCGSGNLTKVIADAGFSEITAVESLQEALDDLESLELKNVTCFKCDLYDRDGLVALAKKSQDTDVLVLDPPREGLKEHFPLLEKNNKLKDVIYISCDLATLSRDVNRMLEVGFKIEEIQPLDMFPQTPHIETFVHLSKR